MTTNDEDAEEFERTVTVAEGARLLPKWRAHSSHRGRWASAGALRDTSRPAYVESPATSPHDESFGGDSRRSRKENRPEGKWVDRRSLHRRRQAVLADTGAPAVKLPSAAFGRADEHLGADLGVALLPGGKVTMGVPGFTLMVCVPPPL